ncbi:MAG: tyrosine-protein phosphatase [Chloroflexota bacterium]
MIDLHNHILPGVDDGARSVEEACDMARALVDQGVTTACCTPHTTEWATAGDEASILARVARLRATLAKQSIPLELLPGAEAHITPTLAADVQRHAVPTLNGTPYLLLEFPYDLLPPFFERVVFELRVHGIRPVIAHPERIAPIADDPNILYQLVRRGCLGQLTAMSLAGGFGPRVREVSELMLEHRLVHAIASDAHDAQPGSRLFALPDARSSASRLLGESAASALFDATPAKIVAGEPIEPPEPVEYKRKHFSFLRAFR